MQWFTETQPKRDIEQIHIGVFPKICISETLLCCYLSSAGTSNLHRGTRHSPIAGTGRRSLSRSWCFLSLLLILPHLTVH